MNPNLPPHPKFKIDDAGNVWLNFGEYGGEVELACFSFCGTCLLTVKEVGVARIWDVESGKQVGEIRPNSPLVGRLGVGPTTSPFRVFIESAALDHRGEHALLGLNDGTAGVFRASDGARLSLFHAPDSEPGSAFGLIRAVAFSPDGLLAAIGLLEGTVGVWNVRDGTLRSMFRCPRADQPYDLNDGPRPGMVSSIGISADNRYLFAGYANMTGTIWDLQTGQVHLDWSEHADKIRALFVEGKRARWVTSGGNIWDATHKQAPRKIFTGGRKVAEAVFSPDGKAILSRGTDGTVIFSSIEGEEQTLVAARNDRMSWPETELTLGFDRRGTHWFYPSAHNCLCWAGVGEPKRLERQAPVRDKGPESVEHDFFRMTSQRINGLVLSSDGGCGVTHGWSGDLEIWDLQSGRLRAFVREPDHANAVTFSPDGTLLAIGVLGQGGSGKPREIKLLSPSNGRVIGRLPGHTHQVHRLEFGPDGTWLVSTGLDRAVRFWSVAERKLVTELDYDDLEFEHLSVLADGRILVFRSQCVEVWRGLRSKVATIPLRMAYGERWSISKDQEVIGVTNGRNVALWSIEDGDPIDFFEPSIQSPRQVPDGKLATQLQATAGGLLWEGPSAKFVHVGDGPRGWATPISLSDDGRLALIPTAKGLALIDVDGEQRVVSVLPFEGRLRATRITKEFAFAVNSAGKIYRWKLNGRGVHSVRGSS
jgi:WD40 repeat protein